MRKSCHVLIASFLLSTGAAAQGPDQAEETARLASDSSIPSQSQEREGATALYFADYVDGDGWSAQLVIGNLDMDPSGPVDVEVYDQQGRPVSPFFDSETRFELPAQGSRTLTSIGTGTVRRGWIRVRSQAGSVTGLLTYRHAGTRIEVGVAPVERHDRFALFVEESSEFGTGLAIFKSETVPEIEFRVRDESGNDPVGDVLTLGDFQQRSWTLAEWFQGIETAFLDDFRGLLFLQSANDTSFAPLGLRFGKQQRSLSAVPVIPLPGPDEDGAPNPSSATRPEAGALYFPDYVDGDGWSVQLVLGNLDPTGSATVDVDAYDQQGRPVRGLFTWSRFSIPAQGSRVMKSPGGTHIRRGWIEIGTDSASVRGLLVYRHAGTGIEVSVAPIEPSDHFALFVEESSGIGTGLALFKPQAAPEIELRFRDEAGNDPVGEVLTIDDFQQRARTLPEWLRGEDTAFLEDFRGMLFLRSRDGFSFAPLGLRFGKRQGSLSAVPAIRVPGPPPTVTLSASPTAIDWGGSATLTWSSTNAVSASITPGIGAVPASGSRTVSPTATTTYLITAVDDSGRTATASAALTVAAPADLAVDAPSVSDSTLSPGQSFDLTATVRNRGASRSGETTLRWYRSSDAEISTGDRAVGTDTVSALATSGASEESIRLNAPRSAGTYYYGGCVEPVGGETATGNNCSDGVAVTVEPAPSPPPSAPPAPDEVELTWQECSGEIGVYKGEKMMAVTLRFTFHARVDVRDLHFVASVNNANVRDTDLKEYGTVWVGDLVAGQKSKWTVQGVARTTTVPAKCNVRHHHNSGSATEDMIVGSEVEAVH